MTISVSAQLLASAALAAIALVIAAPAVAAPAAATPAKTCGSPIFDPANDCKVREDGVAKLQCKAMRDGSLQGCTVVSETPEGKGFGAAALDSATRVHIKPDDTRPADGASLVLPFRFKAGS